MEFLDPVARKKKTRRLFLGYGLVSILVALATYILVATAIGFELFSTNGELVQNGLLFLETKPVAADVIVNGVPENDKTDSKLALKGGQYDVSLKANGYQDWNKKITVDGGKVRFVIYPVLYPSKITPKDIKGLPPNTGMVAQSLDRHWLIIQTNASIPSIDIFDLSQPGAPSSSVVIPQTILISKDGNFGTLELVEWSDDNRHFIVSQKLADGTQNFLMIDRENIDASINLNTTFAVDPTSVSFRDKKSDKFYFYFASGGLLRPADLKARTVGAQLLDQVLSFKPYGNDLISYTTTKDAQAGQVAAKIFSGGKSYALGEAMFDPDSKYFLDIAQFDGDWYYVVGSHQSDKVQIFRNPLNFSAAKEAKKPAVLATLRAGVPDFLGFSANTRFVLVQSKQSVAVYDADEKTSYRYDLPHEIDTGSKVSWIDGHRYQFVSGGKMYVAEFDGLNSHDLGSVKGVQAGYFDREYAQLYTINTATPNAVLQQSSLVVDK